MLSTSSATQTPPRPLAIALALLPTGILATTLPLSGSTRARPPADLPTQTAPDPTATGLTPATEEHPGAARRVVCRDPTVGSSLIELPAPAARDPDVAVAGREPADAGAGGDRADHRPPVGVDPGHGVVGPVRDPDALRVGRDVCRLDSRRDRRHHLLGGGVDDRKRVRRRELGSPPPEARTAAITAASSAPPPKRDASGAAAGAAQSPRASPRRGGAPISGSWLRIARSSSLELGPGVEAELAIERLARIAVGLERLGLAAGPVERQHQLRPQSFAGWMVRDQPLQLRDQRLVAAEGEVGLDPILDRDQPRLLEPGDLVLGERLIGEVGERRPAPERERLIEARRRSVGVAAVERLAALGGEPGETLRVDVVGARLEDVAPAPRRDKASSPSALRRRET